MRFAGTLVLLVSAWVGAATPAFAQTLLDDTVNSSSQVLREIMAVPNKCIPESLLRDAQGIAIVPNMVKGGFIIGLERGKGVLSTRDDNGLWRAPVFITVTGGSVGAQAGVQAIDLVLVFKTKRGVQNILKGKVTIGADLSVAAGPVGRQAMAGTDGKLQAEIYSYSRSRGLFAGVAIDGATLRIEHGANAEYYALRPGQPAGTIPASGIALAQLVDSYAPAPRPVVVPQVQVQLQPQVQPQPPPTYAQPDEREVVREQLVAVAQRLQTALDPAWQQYLALPPEVITGQPLPPGGSFEPIVNRYQVVASEAKYRALNQNNEFQETFGLLKRYATLSQPRPAGSLPLPPPPGQ
ncbi:lipid-binding SYLF domain-containing protein [soil metagenome]